MIISTSSPVNFVTGEMLSIDDLNSMFAYVRDATLYAAQKRYNRSVLVIPFVTSVASAYTHADIGTDTVQFRLKCPNTCVIERAYLHGNLTCTSEIKVDITTSAGATPTGAVSPWLSTQGGITDATVDTEDVSLDRIQLVAGTEYKITISGGGAAVDMQRFDVILHLATDRWIPSGSLINMTAISSALAVLDPASTTTATDITSRGTVCSTYAGYFASNKTAPAPMMYHVHGLTSALDADLRTFRVPRCNLASTYGAYTQSNAIRMYVFALTSAGGNPGEVVTATLQNSSGSTLQTASADASGAAGWITGDSGSFSQSLTGGTLTDASNDYRIVLATTTAATVTKAHVILWISR